MSLPIFQSGSITPGHPMTWITDGVAGDTGPQILPSNVLARLLSADFNSILDQSIQFPKTITAFRVSNIIITNPSLSLTTAVGGFYPTTAKGGTPLVANTQIYSSLTAASKLLSATLAAAVASTRYSSANVDNINGYLTLYLSLTTGQGVSATADIYVIGDDLSV